MNRQTNLIIFIFCTIKLILHLIADSNSGFQGDELLHIETGKHLAFGYMEFPPLIGLLAFIQNLFGSNSVFIHHLFSHLASLLIIIYVAKTIIELGGKNKAICNNHRPKFWTFSTTISTCCIQSIILGIGVLSTDTICKIS